MQEIQLTLPVMSENHKYRHITGSGDARSGLYHIPERRLRQGTLSL